MNPNATQADAVRRIVTLHAATPDGFHYRMSEAIGVPQATASQTTARMMRDGLVVRVKVKGHLTRLHDTPEASQAWASMHAPICTDRLTLREKAKASRQLLLALASRAQGVAAGECPKDVAMVTWHRHANGLQRAGMLFVDDERQPFRYYSTDAAAERSRQVSLQAVAQARKAAVIRKRAQQKEREALSKKTRPARPARPSQALRKPKAPAVHGALAKPARLSYREVAFLRSAAGQPKVQAAPRPEAAIVHTAQTRYSSRLMGLGRYEAAVPFMRIGQPGWAMSVGGAA